MIICGKPQLVNITGEEWGKFDGGRANLHCSAITHRCYEQPRGGSESWERQGTEISVSAGTLDQAMGTLCVHLINRDLLYKIIK